MNTGPYARMVFTLLLTIIGGGCTLLVGLHLDQQFGKSSPRNRLTTTPGVEVRTVKYVEDVKPILGSVEKSRQRRSRHFSVLTY